MGYVQVWTSVGVLLQGRLLRDGRAGNAVVNFFLPDEDEDGGRNWHKARAEVEITLDDGTEPYTVRGIMNGQPKMAPFVRPGMTLPVKVKQDKPKRLVIDWDAWKANGGLDAAKALGDYAEAGELNVAAWEECRSGATGNAGSTGEALQPGLNVSALRRNALFALPHMTGSVRDGTMPRSDLENWLGEQLAMGALTEEDAAAARAGLDET